MASASAPARRRRRPRRRRRRSRSRPGRTPAAHRAAPGGDLPPPPPPAGHAAVTARGRRARIVRATRRRAPAGRLDRRHRALEGPRVPRGRARPLPRRGWPAPARSGSRGPARGAPAGIVVATDGFLLGGFIALLAVRPDASGQGLGQRAGRSRRGPGVRQRAAGCSSRATPTTAPRCVSTDGWASRAWAGFPIWSGEGRIELLLRKPRATELGQRRPSAARTKVGYHWAPR